MTEECESPGREALSEVNGVYCRVQPCISLVYIREGVTSAVLSRGSRANTGNQLAGENDVVVGIAAELLSPTSDMSGLSALRRGFTRPL